MFMHSNSSDTNAMLHSLSAPGTDFFWRISTAMEFLVLADNLMIHKTMYKRPLTDPLVAVSSQYRDTVSAHATSVAVAVF